MNKINRLDVFYDNRHVGTLVKNQVDRVCAFEYSKEWLQTGFSISPFSLPLKSEVFIAHPEPLDGLHGVFNDSLPDGWGRLVVDRLMASKGENPFELESIDRLAIVADTGMGALEYRPSMFEYSNDNKMSFDDISLECKKLLETNESVRLDELFKMGGSPGGARPKILTSICGEEWLVKFFSKEDNEDSGLMEYEYAKCARECGIEFPEFRLFESNICSGYFGVKRFDRVNEKKVHMITAAGLLETSHRIPNLDYNILMKLTMMLTGEMSECEKLFRRMCFNIFAHNRDDHSKNFSYLYNEAEERWILSPAYDLTYSNSIGGEHATTVNGNGRNPGKEDIMAVAKNIGIPNARQVVEDVQSCVNDMLRMWC